MKDLTKNYDYERLIREEKEHYSKIEVTERLTEGGAHANSAWNHYWERVGRVLDRSGCADLARYLCQNVAKGSQPLEVLSLGSGYCGHEIELARGMTRRYRLTCTDVNESVFEKAKAVAHNERLSMEFRPADLNFIQIDPGRYDLIFAHAAIHHVINLENLFEQLAHGLRAQGVFHLTEVVGKNRKLIWESNERYANALLDLIPHRYTHGIRLAVPEDVDGMEGIRQEDIMPLLRQHFSPVFEYRHGAFMRFICTHGDLGPLLDPRNSEARRYLDFLIDCDECAVRYGVLQPLEIWGLYKR
jgi:SAM-dependent methyltransferase